MHIAIIMDGNRRWARSHALQTLIGHTRGAAIMEETLEWAAEYDIDTITFWALAKKNIEERSTEELAYLYRLLSEEIQKLLPKLQEKDFVFDTIGNLSLLPQKLQ